ncbi:hypothetical protein [Amycolatopsis pittospori]|uniref:hypothetical protein n=1 Tax=Amycolatopsis pittospori TaxID=2749434 RepID=UPI0015F022C5|nr:hypothetical protein [Amycolatopsis pittospori]
MSGAAVVHRRGLVPSRAGARILFAGGLALSGWILSAVLSTPASAEEATPPTSPTYSTPETSVVQPSKETESGKTTTEDESTSDSGTVEAKKPAETPEATPETKTEEPAPAASEELEATVEDKAVSSANSVEKSTTSSEPAEKSTKDTQPQASNGLLGGLIGGVLDVVTNTVGGVLETVTGVVGGIGEKVVVPILTPDPSDPGKPTILPGVGDVLDPVFGGGSGDSASGSVTIAVPAKNLLPSEPAPVVPAPRPFVPAETPAPAATQNHRVTLPTRVQLEKQTEPAAPVESDTHASRDGGGSGGGGGLPSTPVAPLAPTTNAHPGHDNSGGGRGPLAVLDSGMPATQLKLIGAGCDHEGERTGREAALPATSPD